MKRINLAALVGISVISGSECETQSVSTSRRLRRSPANFQSPSNIYPPITMQCGQSDRCRRAIGGSAR